MHENIIYGKNGEDVGVQLLNIILRQYLYVVSWAHITEFSVIKYMKYKNICLFFLQFWNLILEYSDNVVLFSFSLYYNQNAHPYPSSYIIVQY
jgi:hypothetical protein